MDSTPLQMTTTMWGETPQAPLSGFDVGYAHVGGRPPKTPQINLKIITFFRRCFLIALACLIGTSDMDSTPLQMTTTMWGETPQAPLSGFDVGYAHVGGRPPKTPQINLKIITFFRRCFLIALACLIGTSDMDSTPPQMTTSATPLAIKPVPVVTAALDEIQAIVKVWAGRDWGRPAPRHASRITFDVFTSAMTVPPTAKIQKSDCVLV